MEDIANEFNSLRLTLSPLLEFVDEMKAIRKSRKISEESSITLLELLEMEIKEDIVTTVITMQKEENKKLNDLDAQFKEFNKEIRDKMYDQVQQMTNLEMDYHSLGDIIARQGGFIENQNKNFDNFKKDLNDKATINEVLELKKTLKHYTPNSDFNHLSNQVLELASKSSVETIRKDLMKFEKRIQIYVTKEEMLEALKKNEENSKLLIETKYLLSEKFEEEQKFSEKRFDRLEEDIQGLFQKNEGVNDTVRKKIKELYDLIKKRPWDPEIQNLQALIDECSLKSEFKTLVNFVNPKIDSFSRTVAEISGQVFQFEKILERYDEILLEKASKDDIKQINARLPAFALLTKLNELFDRIKSESAYNSQKFVETTSKADEQASQINLIFQKIEAIRKDNQDVASIASTLIGFSEKLTEKADKSDIYLIYDVMGRKEDIIALKEVEDIAKKQVEMIVVILQALCRTLLGGGEAPADISKKRLHLYRNLTGLLSWVNGDETIRTKLTSSCRSPLNINLKTEGDFDTNEEALPSTRYNRKNRRFLTTTSPRSKGSVDFVNLPPIT